jgi:hypothetical protein
LVSNGSDSLKEEEEEEEEEEENKERRKKKKKEQVLEAFHVKKSQQKLSFQRS